MSGVMLDKILDVLDLKMTQRTWLAVFQTHLFVELKGLVDLLAIWQAAQSFQVALRSMNKQHILKVKNILHMQRDMLVDLSVLLMRETFQNVMLRHSEREQIFWFAWTQILQYQKQVHLLEI